MNECLVFDVFGDFACFKKHFTTSSPLTFDFPPKTVLAGILGAIIGLDFEQKYDLFQGMLALKILSAGSKKYVGINWIDTKPRDGGKFGEIPSNVAFLEALNLPPTAEVGAFIGMTWPGKENMSTQINVEILLEPRYRIYYPDTSPYYSDLKVKVEQHKAIFTPFLGISEFIANFELVDVTTVQEVKIVSNKETLIDSVIPVLDPASFDPLTGITDTPILIDRLPRTMVPGRKVIEYTSFVYTRDGTVMNAKVSSYYHVKGSKVDENVIFF